ncbi:hypothetical protein ATE92_1131 [Ulvibacter sp. MAR_2010_11]|uniref:hypothetical protein n=1 Tax=Ulvibacter sp. MAR_2010_11 TaxID=1250229 RepID=UPI000C2BE8F8|nr:hypothetical protein [Ulvibacter sp. MAR_2010_11]PKA82987.1 hypothetical protein ATE92_1131 [Ulvibacter sp. MAR_2010_11]
MKKKLRSQIRALATQILSEDNPDTANMKQNARELYEQLITLEYLESQLDNSEDILEEEALDSKSFREENWFKEPEPVPQPENKEELIEPLIEKIKDIVAQMPKESERVDALLEEVIPKQKYIKNDLEEFAASYQQTPTFERKEPSKGGEIPRKTHNLVVDIGAPTDKPKSLNDAVPQGLNIGLNDRLAFIKHLFDGKSEDYTRVLSQISTMNSYDAAATFIKGKVKPDYNYWLNKEEYSERFLTLIEKSFN